VLFKLNELLVPVRMQTIEPRLTDSDTAGPLGPPPDALEVATGNVPGMHSRTKERGANTFPCEVLARQHVDVWCFVKAMRVSVHDASLHLSHDFADLGFVID
jgi:hypothetical protein